jgi:pimeloyl-ACP methyl ester carboxylesterase
MRRGWKILIGVLLGLAVLLLVNVLVTDGETKNAEVTVPEGKLISLPGGVVQVAEHGPRKASPIVLIHCFTCAIDWWDEMVPLLSPTHRVVAIDLLGHGGSEKPGSGYSMEEQADLVAEAMRQLDVTGATVVGHSLGGTVSTALLERHPRLVKRLAIIDQAPDSSYGDLDLEARLSLMPVIGQAAWRLAPDSSIESGLSQAFAPSYDVPHAFLDDFHRMTFSSYDGSAEGETSYTDERPLDQRIAAADRVPLLVMFGAEEQIYDPRKSLAAYTGEVPNAEGHLIPGAGHSPNVERPALTAGLLLRFARD